MHACQRTRRIVSGALCIVVLASLLAACSSDSTTDGGSATTAPSHGSFDRASGPVRGFDGTTITVASFGIKGQLPGVEWGAKGRIKRFNDTNEVPGVKVKYAEYADDKLDPATALNEARRLVTNIKAFAIVGDTSAYNPGDYFRQQHVPYFGWAFDDTYCSSTSDRSIWGFGFYGCLVPSHPKAMPDGQKAIAEYVKGKTGKEHPTEALFSSDTASGNNSARFQVTSAKASGFNVVFAKGMVPSPGPVADYTPYVQQLLTSDHGKSPDLINCLLSVDCIQIYKLLQANDFKGTFLSPLYSDALLGSMKGSVANIPFVNFNDSNAGITQLKVDVRAVKPEQALDTGVSSAYFATDMFIAALKTIAKKGKQFITPENIRVAATRQTWQIEGLVGPTKYPGASVMPTPDCYSLVFDDGTAWKTVVPYRCHSDQLPIEN